MYACYLDSCIVRTLLRDLLSAHETWTYAGKSCLPVCWKLKGRKRREIIVRGQSYFSRLPKYWPPIPLSARQCPPPATKAGGTHSPGGEGDGGSIFWKTREIGLPSYNDLSTVVMNCVVIMDPEIFWLSIGLNDLFSVHQILDICLIGLKIYCRIMGNLVISCSESSRDFVIC